MLLRIRNRIINTDQIIEARYSVSRKRAGDDWLSGLFMNKPAGDPNDIIITKRLDIVFAPGAETSHNINLTGEEAEELWRALCALAKSIRAPTGTPVQSAGGGERRESDSGQGEKA